MKKSSWPPLGFVLRSLINAGGYRRYLVERGQDKDLDDIAIEAKNRQSTVAARMQEIEARCAQELAKECGHDWAHFFTHAWNQTRGAMQIFVQPIDASPLSQTQCYSLFMEQFAVPMVSGFLTLTNQHHQGPHMQQWLAQPFQSWLSLAAQRSGITEEILLTNLGNHCNAARLPAPLQDTDLGGASNQLELFEPDPGLFKRKDGKNTQRYLLLLPRIDWIVIAIIDAFFAGSPTADTQTSILTDISFILVSRLHGFNCFVRKRFAILTPQHATHLI